MNRQARQERPKSEFEERVIKISRNAKVVKGGRRFSFSALVAIGDGKGRVGLGHGKAPEVPEAIRKAIEHAHKKIINVPIIHETLPHQIIGEFGAARVTMLPASKGTGVIAGGPVRAIIEVSGLKNILTKSHGSSNQINIAKATINGLERMRTAAQVAELRGKTVPEILGF